MQTWDRTWPKNTGRFGKNFKQPLKLTGLRSHKCISIKGNSRINTVIQIKHVEHGVNNTWHKRKVCRKCKSTEQISFEFDLTMTQFGQLIKLEPCPSYMKKCYTHYLNNPNLPSLKIVWIMFVFSRRNFPQIKWQNRERLRWQQLNEPNRLEIEM